MSKFRLQFSGKYRLVEDGDVEDAAAASVGMLSELMELLAKRADDSRQLRDFAAMRMYQGQLVVAANAYNAMIAIVLASSGHDGLSPQFIVQYDRMHRTGYFNRSFSID